MIVPHGTLILVIDGGGLRLLRNNGREPTITLDLLEQRTFHNPPNRMLISDGPGRSFESSGPARHSYAVPDHHRQREEHFAEEAMEMLRERAGRTVPVILVAPPRMLGILRTRLGRDVAGDVIGEIDKDLADRSPEDSIGFLRDHRGIDQDADKSP